MKLEIELTENQLDLLKYAICLVQSQTNESLYDTKYDKRISKDEIEIKQLTDYILELEKDQKDLQYLQDKVIEVQ